MRAGSLIVSSALTILAAFAQEPTPQPARQAQAQSAPPIEPVKTSITITEQISTEVPASVTILGREEVQEQAGVNLDDRLRSVPGFSLFRRSSSLVANPTTQGVSLRGLGSSGASRTLVLWDGVPINDPFGGWVYWTLVAPEQLERVELIRGASTSVFGDRAMSGAISMFSRPPERYRVTAGYEGGNRNSQMVTGGFAGIWSQFGASLNLRAFDTDGYFIVPANRRGRADSLAGVRFIAADTKLDFLGNTQRLFVKVDLLAEARQNGTVLTTNSTGLGTIAANYSRQWADDNISILGYHTREQYHASFSSVSADRNTERITFTQTVPSEAVGAAGLWRHSQRSWNLLAGGDMQRVEGFSTDRLVPPGLRIGGGSQLQHGVFAELDASRGPAKFFLGARHQFTGQDATFFSPSAGVVLGRHSIRGRASVYRSFRAPTLNELFREFRVGNAVTQANAALRPETMFGAEAGVDFVGESTHASLTVYRHSLDNLITNVTLSSTPALIVRQRQNASAALARGIEANIRQSWRSWRGELAYLLSDSRVSTGERIAQVPRHQGSAQLTWHHRTTLVSAGVRSYSYQFEDDLNRFLLPGFASVQGVFRQGITQSLYASFSIENALDRQYLVGFSPTPLIGPPRLWRVGLKWDGPVR